MKGTAEQKLHMHASTDWQIVCGIELKHPNTFNQQKGTCITTLQALTAVA